jgi:Na+-transporting methylmalonyl-CoA/oxaloacetate decarboxylase gamma subunit
MNVMILFGIGIVFLVLYLMRRRARKMKEFKGR